MRSIPAHIEPLVSRYRAAALWALLVVFIACGSLGALSPDGSKASALPGLSLPDLLQNVLLYIPFGVLGIWTIQPHQPPTARHFLIVTAIGAATSALFESLQLLSTFRIASILDVGANVAGVALGVSAAGQTRRVMAAAHQWLKPTGLFDSPLSYALAATVAGTAIAAWYPYDITLDVSTLSERTRSIRADPWQGTSAGDLWLQGIGFFVIAALLAACLRLPATRAARFGAVGTIAIALLIDVGQLSMGRHSIGGAAVAAQTAGGAAGALATLLVKFARRRDLVA